MSVSRPKPRVTLREIARELNVSHATVSRALKDDPRISAPVRQQVRRMVQKMGYQPDPMLAALSHYRQSKIKHPVTASLAWINHWPNPKQLRTYKEFELYWRGASEEARRNGYRLDEFSCPGEMSPERLQSILLARGIRGLLLPPSWAGNTPDWSRLRWDEFNVVRFGFSLEIPRAHVVSSDQLSNGLLAFERMLARRYRRIGMVMWKKQGTKIVRFAAGYLYAQLQIARRDRLPPLLLTERGMAGDQRDLVAWLKRTRPDAILTDITQLGRMLADAGHRVPQDIGLAALSVLDGHADAGIYQNSEEIGAAAVQQLISLIHHNQRGIPRIPREVLIPGQWVDGSTLPRRKP